jgi:hypothetical protein
MVTACALCLWRATSAWQTGHEQKERVMAKGQVLQTKSNKPKLTTKEKQAKKKEKKAKK